MQKIKSRSNGFLGIFLLVVLNYLFAHGIAMAQEDNQIDLQVCGQTHCAAGHGCVLTVRAQINSYQLLHEEQKSGKLEYTWSLWNYEPSTSSKYMSVKTHTSDPSTTVTLSRDAPIGVHSADITCDVHYVIGSTKILVASGKTTITFTVHTFPTVILQFNPTPIYATRTSTLNIQVIPDTLENIVAEATLSTTGGANIANFADGGTTENITINAGVGSAIVETGPISTPSVNVIANVTLSRNPGSNAQATLIVQNPIVININVVILTRTAFVIQGRADSLICGTIEDIEVMVVPNIPGYSIETDAGSFTLRGNWAHLPIGDQVGFNIEAEDDADNHNSITYVAEIPNK